MTARPPGTFWIDEGRLLAGPYPQTESGGSSAPELADLLAAGVTRFVDLTEAGELPDYTAQLAALAPGASWQRFPIPDFGVPDSGQLQTLLQELDRALAGGHVVYLHCRGGCGRTGTVAGSWLANRGTSGKDALELLSRLRSGLAGECPETEAQRALVRAWPAQPTSHSQREGE